MERIRKVVLNVDSSTEELLKDSLTQANRGIRIRDRIIGFMLLLCVLMGCSVGILGMITYDTLTYEYVITTTEETTETISDSNNKDIDMSSSGDNANVEYNDVAGDQYNDNATHNEGGVE